MERGLSLKMFFYEKSLQGFRTLGGLKPLKLRSKVKFDLGVIILYHLRSEFVLGFNELRIYFLNKYSFQFLIWIPSLRD